MPTRKADLFVSIHINASGDAAAQGIETYFLNLTTDSSAIEVAARENATTSKSLSDLQLIINDLMLNSKINESSRFANCVQKSLISSVLTNGYQGRDFGVKQAPFYVLLGRRCLPSCANWALSPIMVILHSFRVMLTRAPLLMVLQRESTSI